MSIADKIARAKADIDAVHQDGIAEGKQAEYDVFWDGFQDYGKRGYYMAAFSRWPESIFWPKYDIRVTEGSPSLMFSSANVPNLKQRLKDCGVVLDFSSAVNITEALAYNSYFTNLPTVDTRNVSTFSHVFANDTALVEIEKFILKADGSQTFGSRIFGNCRALEDITIEGVIGSNGFDMQWSTKLSKASIQSIINALSTVTSGLTVTLSKTAVNNAFGGSTSAEWLALVATRSNWTVALA